MSFKVDWNTLETDSLASWTKDLLTAALNSGKRPNVLASNIEIKDLNFGKIAPTFEILEIGEIGQDRFRGIFKINYNGDFHLTLHTKVQANPLKIYSDNSLENEVANYCDIFDDPNNNSSNYNYNFITPDFLLSNDPFNLPLDLRLSDIKISGIGIIVFSKSKGLTLVFRNDPLDSIKVSSTFDSVQVLANFLQKQIENQIRDLFRETLPTLIHKLSLKYTLFNDNTLNDLHKQHEKQLQQKINDNNDDDDHEQQDILTPTTISSNNLIKLGKLFSSRETLKLNIPKFKKVIQRSHLDRFNKKLYYPNLINSLYSNLNLSNQNLLDGNGNINNNGIPIDLLLSNDFDKIDNILKEISNIQTYNYNNSNHLNNKNNVNVKPKRRTIKLGKKLSKSKATAVSANTTMEDSDSMATLIDAIPATPLTHSVSMHSTLSPSKNSSPIVHTKPMRPTVSTNDAIHSKFIRSLNLSPSPSPLQNTNSSVLSGVGIGNNYFNFTNPTNTSSSPIKQYYETNTPTIISIPVKKESKISSIDITKLNDKLKTFKLKTNDEKASHYRSHNDQMFELPPPPYYQT